jgi:hypothetical protein
METKSRRDRRIALLVEELRVLTEGEVAHSTTLDSRGRMSKKIVVEYDIQQKDTADN